MPHMDFNVSFCSSHSATVVYYSDSIDRMWLADVDVDALVEISV